MLFDVSLDDGNEVEVFEKGRLRLLVGRLKIEQRYFFH